ncbi:unnamed protein product [Prunus armeniaca]|uniref:Uncharacterized protein n=1 Tax=Prunus armeniaca TaxID=36596 RepID=A0A6J5XCL2_PRUAR|nr:unnamed protein product [Prunus armeniaca]
METTETKRTTLVEEDGITLSGLAGLALSSLIEEDRLGGLARRRRRYRSLWSLWSRSELARHFFFL